MVLTFCVNFGVTDSRCAQGLLHFEAMENGCGFGRGFLMLGVVKAGHTFTDCLLMLETTFGVEVGERFKCRWAVLSFRCVGGGWVFASRSGGW